MLTTARCRCTKGETVSTIKVLVGNVNSGTRVAISAISDVPPFDSTTWKNDFSILTLAEPVTFTDKVFPACLPSDVVGRPQSLDGDTQRRTIHITAAGQHLFCYHRVTVVLIVAVCAAALVVIASFIVGVCCWKMGRCRRDTDAEEMDINPEYGEEYYDKNNYHTKVVDECNYYGDDDVMFLLFLLINHFWQTLYNLISFDRNKSKNKSV